MDVDWSRKTDSAVAHEVGFEQFSNPLEKQNIPEIALGEAAQSASFRKNEAPEKTGYRLLEIPFCPSGWTSRI
jgi:hypothetical protein